MECCVDPTSCDHQCKGEGSGQAGNNAAGQETTQVENNAGRGQGVLAVRQAGNADEQHSI